MAQPATGSGAHAPAASHSPANLLINIDNGGTLTDICVLGLSNGSGQQVWRTKTLTTPYDLSKCLFDGLKKASRSIYGEENVQRLLLATEYIRYSTTQGTNALVERKGPRLGLILGGDLKASQLQTDAQSKELFASLVGERLAVLDLSLDEEALEAAAARAVTQLTSAGANRLVIAFGGAARGEGERRMKRLLLRKFPPHMLGALPMLYSHEVVEDEDDARRAWTSLFNAFLHPPMERFLYAAEHQLREYKTRNPLLIFRNDGQSARVARTIALKTYSSGPRGGAEGAKALAAHYGFAHLLSMDIGGTTTDVAVVQNREVQTDRRGRVQGVPTSFELCDVQSFGVGGSSILKVVDGQIQVGPESVGGAPGPACFGLGGKEATITDAFLLMGLLDPASYFGGELKIDVERARAAIHERIAVPLKLSDEAAAQAMETAWVAKVAADLKKFPGVGPETTLAAFGGAGPFVACRIAEATGLRQVVIPGLAAVFSAFGIGFSDIAHHYEVALASTDAAGLAAAKATLLERARRGMFAEGFPVEDCELAWTLQVGDQSLGFDGEKLPAAAKGSASLKLQAIKRIAHARMSGRFGVSQHPALAGGNRSILGKPLPLFKAEQQTPGASANGPVVLEEAFFTARIDNGWRFEINEAGDILLSRS